MRAGDNGMQPAVELIGQALPRADDALRHAVIAGTGKQTDDYVAHNVASQTARYFDDALGEFFDFLLQRIAGDELASHILDWDGEIYDFVIAPASANFGGVDADFLQGPFSDRLARGHHNVARL